MHSKPSACFLQQNHTQKRKGYTMKIYNGWILRIEGGDFSVIGSLKIRGTQSYILKALNDGVKTSISRNRLLSGMNDKSITYMGNV